MVQGGIRLENKVLCIQRDYYQVHTEVHFCVLVQTGAPETIEIACVNRKRPTVYSRGNWTSHMVAYTN